MSFLKRMLLHYAAFFTFLQAMSWAFGMDQAVQRQLARNPLLVVLGMGAYAGWYFLMYGNREKEYYDIYRKRNSELPPCPMPENKIPKKKNRKRRRGKRKRH